MIHATMLLFSLCFIVHEKTKEAKVIQERKHIRIIISMEDDESTRPAIGFPLGLALLGLMLVIMSLFFASCIYWDKLRSLLGASSDNASDLQADNDFQRKSVPPQPEPKLQQARSLPVLMPGDQVPKFIAIACPCEGPARDDRVSVKVVQHKTR